LASRRFPCIVSSWSLRSTGVAVVVCVRHDVPLPAHLHEQPDQAASDAVIDEWIVIQR
jgi:hypothetical protein